MRSTGDATPQPMTRWPVHAPDFAGDAGPYGVASPVVRKTCSLCDRGVTRDCGGVNPAHKQRDGAATHHDLSPVTTLSQERFLPVTGNSPATAGAFYSLSDGIPPAAPRPDCLAFELRQPGRPCFDHNNGGSDETLRHHHLLISRRQHTHINSNRINNTIYSRVIGWRHCAVGTVGTDSPGLFRNQAEQPGHSCSLNDIRNDTAKGLPATRGVVFGFFHAPRLWNGGRHDCGEEQPEITRSFYVE